MRMQPFLMITFPPCQVNPSSEHHETGYVKELMQHIMKGAPEKVCLNTMTESMAN